MVSQTAFGTVVQPVGQAWLVLRHAGGVTFGHSQHTGGVTQSQKFGASSVHVAPGVEQPPAQPPTAALNWHLIVVVVVLLLVVVVVDVVVVVGMPDFLAGVHRSWALPNFSGNVPN